MNRLVLTFALLCLVPRLAAAQQPETIEDYAQDAIGSIRVVFNPTGTVLARQDYAPFGRQLFTVPAMPKDGFVGQEKDDETDQAYFHARMFKSRVGRFAQPDPVIDGVWEPQRWNRYAYALNAPLDYTDTTGLAADPCQVTDTNTCAVAPDPWAAKFEQCFWAPWLCGWGAGGGGGSGPGDAGAGGSWGGSGSGGARTGDTSSPAQDKPSLETLLSNPNSYCTVENRCLMGVMPLSPNAMGTAGVQVVKTLRNIGQEGKQFVVNGRLRKADGFFGNVIIEIKNVARLAYTQQLKDYVAFAKEHPGVAFELWVRSGAKLSGPLRLADEAGEVIIKRFIWP